MILDGKVLWYLEQVSPFDKDNSSVGSIATSIIANEVEKMKGKDIFKYSLKSSKKVKTLPIKTSHKISSKREATFVSDLLFQRSVSCISFNNCKGHKRWVYPQALFESTI